LSSAPSSEQQEKDTIASYKKQVIYTLISKFQNIQNDQIQQDLCGQLKEVQQKMI
jgi:hypothetical protein